MVIPKYAFVVFVAGGFAAVACSSSPTFSTTGDAGPPVVAGDDTDDADDEAPMDASVGDASHRDAGRDAGRDGGRDGGHDAGHDAQMSTDAHSSVEASIPDCQADSECSSGTRCFHTTQGNRCITTCDPLAPTTGCPSQQACNDFAEDSTGNLFTQCMAYGSGTESASCTDSRDCALGLLCARFSGVLQCARPCDATHSCVKSGQSCTPLGGSNNQASAYAACNPPKPACVPSCTAKACGTDGCGGSCGTCGTGKTCNLQGTCDAICVPSCGSRQCGFDGCGGSCGFCGAGTTCSSGQCVATTPSCDPVYDSGCSAAEGCYLLSTGQATCAVTGTGTQGSSCTTTSNCAGGYACFAHTCRKICDKTSGDGCTGTQTCNGVTGWAVYGACN